MSGCLQKSKNKQPFKKANDEMSNRKALTTASNDEKFSVNSRLSTPTQKTAPGFVNYRNRISYKIGKKQKEVIQIRDTTEDSEMVK